MPVGTRAAVANVMHRGASQGGSFWSALHPVTMALAWGTASGLAAAALAARSMRALLHGVGPADPARRISAPAIFVSVCALAAALAAARSRRANPIDLLRQ